MDVGTIVVGYDGSPDAWRAARWALDEAARTGAPVELVHAYEDAPGRPAGWPPADVGAAVDTLVRDLERAAAAGRPDVTVRTAVEPGPAAGTLLRRAAGAGMVVLGGHGGSAVTGLLGTVAADVADHAAGAAVVVRGRGDPAGPVVVGVDDSGPARRALAFAFEQAAHRGVALRVVRAWLPPALTGSGVPVDAVGPAARRRLLALLAPWRERYPAVPVGLEVRLEHPARALVAASATAQLTVVGSRGPGAFRGTVLGSVSRHLLRHSPSTVAVVRGRSAAR